MTQRERDIIDAANKYREQFLAFGPVPTMTCMAERELLIAALLPDDGRGLQERRDELLEKAK